MAATAKKKKKPNRRWSKKAARTIAKRMAAQKKKFLKELRKCDEPVIAGERARVSKSALYLWRDNDQEFAAAWDSAREAARANLKSSAHEEAIDGDRDLKKFLLKARFPQEFSERFEINIKNDPQIVALATAFIEVLREFVAKELFETAFLRLGAMTGMVREAQKQIKS